MYKIKYTNKAGEITISKISKAKDFKKLEFEINSIVECQVGNDMPKSLHNLICEFNKTKNNTNMEKTVVRDNLINDPNYTPYCSSNCMSRTVWNGTQFKCPTCNFVTEFPKEFIDRYKLKHNK